MARRRREPKAEGGVRLKPLQVMVSSPGKAHAFQLARQLARRGLLDRLVTDDVRALGAPGIPRSRVVPLAPLDLFVRAGPKLPRLGDRPWLHWRVRLHDHLAARFIGEANVVVAWAGGARVTLTRARERGALAILERGSTHIEHQNRVLVEEFARFGRSIEPISAEGIRNELAEYAVADRIMVPSTFARRTYVAHGVPPEKLLQVPYGADVSVFQPGEQEDKTFRVAFVGAISLQKGVVYLLEAMKKLALPGAELLLVGPVLEEMREVLARFPGLYRAVGPQPHAEVARLLQQSTVFAFPSLQEGLSLALREAHASGLPIVATDASGAEDVIVEGEDGFVVPCRDVDALAQRLERLYRDPDLRRTMSETASRRARGWSWNDYGDAVVQAYESARR